LTIGLLALPQGGVQADSLQDNATEAERLAGEAVSKLLRALDLMMDSVPQYAAPEVLPNGDIILRRLNPKDDAEEPVETDAEDGIET
jgi:hypothetical protein